MHHTIFDSCLQTTSLVQRWTSLIRAWLNQLCGGVRQLLVVPVNSLHYRAKLHVSDQYLCSHPQSVPHLHLTADSATRTRHPLHLHLALLHVHHTVIPTQYHRNTHTHTRSGFSCFAWIPGKLHHLSVELLSCIYPTLDPILLIRFHAENTLIQQLWWNPAWNHRPMQHCTWHSQRVYFGSTAT